MGRHDHPPGVWIIIVEDRPAVREGLDRLMQGSPGLRLQPPVRLEPRLVVTAFEDGGRMVGAMCNAAGRALLQGDGPRRFLEALRATGGEPGAPHGLGARECAVLRLLAEGHSYKTAAAELGIRIDTVRHHVRRIYAKLGVHTMSAAVAEGLRRGLVR